MHICILYLLVYVLLLVAKSHLLLNLGLHASKCLYFVHVSSFTALDIEHLYMSHGLSHVRAESRVSGGGSLQLRKTSFSFVANPWQLPSLGNIL